MREQPYMRQNFAAVIICGLPDALQIAAVLSAGCEAFLTNDKKLKQTAELRVIVLDDLIFG
jgi:predicted nucleic acid-binding protein